MERSVYLMRIKTIPKIYLNIALFPLIFKAFLQQNTLKTKDEHGDMREEVDDLRFLAAKVPFSGHAHQRSLRSLEHNKIKVENREETHKHDSSQKSLCKDTYMYSQVVILFASFERSSLNDKTDMKIRESKNLVSELAGKGVTKFFFVFVFSEFNQTFLLDLHAIKYDV